MPDDDDSIFDFVDESHRRWAFTFSCVDRRAAETARQDCTGASHLRSLASSSKSVSRSMPWRSASRCVARYQLLERDVSRPAFRPNWTKPHAMQAAA